MNWKMAAAGPEHNYMELYQVGQSTSANKTEEAVGGVPAFGKQRCINREITVGFWVISAGLI